MIKKAVKKSVLITFVHFIWFSVAFAQQKKDTCDCSVLISPEFKGSLKLMNDTNKVIKTLKHNFTEEDYLILNITAEKDSFFFATVSYSIAGSIANGWLKKSDQIGVFIRNYSSPLVIYNEPDKGAVKKVIKGYNNELVPIISCHNKWVKVYYKQRNIKYEGWIPPEMQCANSYSTCN